MSDINITVNDEIVNIDIVDEPVLVNVVNSPGVPGAPGQGVPVGGTTGQVLAKNSNTNYDTEWVNVSGGVPYSGATGNVNLGEYELKAGQLTLDVSPTGTAAVGTTRWNDTTGVSETTLKGGSVILKNGVDLVARVVNKVTPNTTLTKAAYQAVRVSGAQGQRLAVAFAQANNDNNSADTIGLVTETIATNQEGFIITVGQIENINTTGSLQGETWADGDVLYLSPTIAGAITNVKPNATVGHIVVIGYVEYAHANNGKIYVKVMNGWELDELHDVSITSVANNEALIYESSSALWKNKSIATALGYTPANAATTLTINGVTYDLSANRTWTISTGISGSGASGQVAYWTGASAQSGSATLTYTPTTSFLVNNSVTASSAIARGINLTSTLVAAANNDVLVGLDVNPTFTNGAFTGVSNWAIRSTGTIALESTGTAEFRLRSSLISGFLSINFYNPSNVNVGGFGYGNTGASSPYNGKFYFAGVGTVPFSFIMNGTEQARIFSNGNLLLQNGGTFTDSGERLQVTGTMKVTDTSAFGTDTFTNKLNASFGTIGIQSFAVNNSWFGDNVYYNGTNFVRKASGYTGLFYFQGNEGQFRWGSFSSAGTSVTNGSSSNGLISFKMNLDGTIAMGDLSTVSGVYTGANFILFGSSKNIGVNTTTDIASAKFHISSTTQGFLPPRMTTTQKNAITSPAAGLVVYDTTLNKLCVYTTAWETITSI